MGGGAWHLLKAGGATLVVLLLCSVAVVAVTMERMVVLRRARRKARSLAEASNPLHDRESFEAELSRIEAELEKGLPTLATIGSVAPFIGLFGTVIGIMRAFYAMSIHKAAGIAVVGRGIAEALVCTAAGLGVAIVAVVAYNAFRTAIRRILTEIEVEFARRRKR